MVLSPYRGKLLCKEDCSVVDDQGVNFHFMSGNTYQFEYYIEQPNKMRLEDEKTLSFFCELSDLFIRENFTHMGLYQKERWER